MKADPDQDAAREVGSQSAKNSLEIRTSCIDTLSWRGNSMTGPGLIESKFAIALNHYYHYAITSTIIIAISITIGGLVLFSIARSD